MSTQLDFGEVLEVVETLSQDEQGALVEIVRRRAAERGRTRLVAEVREARKEFDEGLARETTPDGLLDEIGS